MNKPFIDSLEDPVPARKTLGALMNVEIEIKHSHGGAGRHPASLADRLRAHACHVVDLLNFLCDGSRPGHTVDIKTDLDREQAAVQRIDVNAWGVTRILHSKRQRKPSVRVMSLVMK